MNVGAIEGQTVEAARARIELPGLLAMRCYAALAIMLFHLTALPKLQIPGYLSFVPTHFSFGVPLFYIVSAFGLFVGTRAESNREPNCANSTSDAFCASHRYFTL